MKFDTFLLPSLIASDQMSYNQYDNIIVILLNNK